MSTKDEEKLMRKELAEKNTLVLNDEQYVISTDDESKNKNKENKIINDEKEIKRLIKPRAYPLFLMEKGAIIVEDLIDSITSSITTKEEEEKERVVILGTGWAAAAFLKGIDTEKYDVTVVSPRNFFLFTPMLAGASVGTVEYRSITEPIRELNSKVKYIEATTQSISPQTRTITSESVTCQGNSCTIQSFTLPYDTLILSVGAQTNTYGIPGVREHCTFLKEVEDARLIRTSIVNCFERASFPNLNEEEKESILTFGVIGAGPTGIEFASELRDFIEEDGPKYYPDLLKFVRIKVIEASSTVLGPFDETLQEEAMRQLTRVSEIRDAKVMSLLPERFQLTELLLDSGVTEITSDEIRLANGRNLRYGMAVWAAGNGPLPITLQLIEALSGKEEQAEAQASLARGRLAVDPWLRVLGGEGRIMAMGDCSCIMSGQLPATAQVASQQGEFLSRLMSLDYDLRPTNQNSQQLLPPKRNINHEPILSEHITSFATQNDQYAAPFQFLNLGILAYTGKGSALAQLQIMPNDAGRVKGKGKIGFGLWRSVYLSKQISARNRLLVFVDWIKTRVFGRDITRL